MGLVDGSCSKDKFPDSMGNHWERANAIVLSWVMNSISKGLLRGVMYATTAKAICLKGSRRWMVQGRSTFIKKFQLWFKDLWNGQVKEIGKEKNGLYILVNQAFRFN
ncbi:uncharacterized protein LOC132066595 [Lycium ferocissimum]|uniref:uncharacterized protein LOC132066595 n=1 Tax=Lycium ferocissimum TaxID=112874 RepID=UPI00281566D2|nr:uncharacterized protein LOC132066595 [Lycium ferocissimum]